MLSALGFALLSIFAILLSLSTLSHGLLQPRRISHGLTESSKYLTRDELWFNQTLDHYSPSVINLPDFVSSSIWIFFLHYRIVSNFGIRIVSNFISGSSRIQTAILWISRPFTSSWWTYLYDDLWRRTLQWNPQWLYNCKILFDWLIYSHRIEKFLNLLCFSW